MNIARQKVRKDSAFTKAELLVVVGVIALLGATIYSIINENKKNGRKVTCRANLKEIALAFKMTAGDSYNNFGFARSTNVGGTQEYVSGTIAYQHFRALSNELKHVRLLVCPADARKPTPSFESLANDNLSYFLNLDADENKPNTSLSGDRLLSGIPARVNGLLIPSTAGNFQWDSGLHNGSSKEAKGNLALSDGSVTDHTSLELTKQLTSKHNATNRFLFPE
ncbi:MAG: hypothetical protein K0Q55_2224 [Verrucomicrobia bacterium]|jgi:hypothetical protein|nr:hypothetical protein [Verrucomicrobiota bacterium]